MATGASPAPRRVAVTGATGFIGQALCTQLVNSGHVVRALVRNPGKARKLPQGVELYQGDITDAAGLRDFPTGMDAVVHCAGNVRGASQAQFDRINVDGLRNLLRAMKMADSPPGLLSLSSLAAREPQLSFYAASKFRGEQVLAELEQPFEWTVFRPPAVYGPGDRELLPLLQLMARGFALIPGTRQARFSMIYIDDLVSAITAWIDCPQAVAGVFTLEDGTAAGYDWQAVTSTLSALSGRPVRILPVPAKALDTIAWINRSLARLLGYSPMLTPEKLRELRHEDWVCDSSALHQALGWQARIQLQEGLKRTIFSHV